MRDNIKTFIETNFFKVRYIFENTSLKAGEPDYLVPLPNVSFERMHPGNLHALDVIYQSEYNENYLTRVRKRVDEPAM